MRENFRLFAKVKGVQPKEVEQEVGKHIRMNGFGNNLLNLHLTRYLLSYDFTLSSVKLNNQ